MGIIFRCQRILISVVGELSLVHDGILEAFLCVEVGERKV